MRWYKLFGSFIPARKCGSTPIIGDMLGFVENERRLDISQDNVYEQLAAQRHENQLNRDWQTQQAEIDRQFQAGQTQQQNQFQTQLAAQQQQYNLQSMKQQALYNSPVYMRQQLESANLNPQVYFGNHGSFSGSSAVAGGASSAPSPAKGAMPASVQGLSPVGFQPNFLNPAELFNGVAQGLKALGEAKKSGVETRFLEDSFEARLQEMIAKGDMAETMNLLQQLDLKFQQSNFDVRLKKAYADYKEVLSNINLLDQKVLTEKEQQALHRATVNLNRSIEALNDKEKQRLGIFIRYLPQTLESEIKRNKAQANQANADAVESRANAAVLSEEKRIRTVAANIKEANSSQELNTVLDDLHAKQAISLEQYNRARVELHRLDKILRGYENSEDLQKVDAILQNFFSIIGLNTSVSISAKQ